MMDGWIDGGDVHGYRERKEERKMGKRKKEKKKDGLNKQPHARTMIV